MCLKSKGPRLLWDGKDEVRLPLELPGRASELADECSAESSCDEETEDPDSEASVLEAFSSPDFDASEASDSAEDDEDAEDMVGDWDGSELILK